MHIFSNDYFVMHIVQMMFPISGHGNPMSTKSTKLKVNMRKRE